MHRFEEFELSHTPSASSKVPPQSVGEQATMLVGGGEHNDNRDVNRPLLHPQGEAQDFVVDVHDMEDERKLGSVMTCMVCFEEFSIELPHFSCPNDRKGHSLCITCFADYINHCCDVWATENTIPIKCQIPKCGYVIPDPAIRDLLNADLVSPRALWDRYCQTQLRVALEKAPQDVPEVPVTCAFCGKYSEFYVKASPDYWKKAEKDRFRAEARKQQALYEATKKMEKDMERKLEEIKRKANEDVNDQAEIEFGIHRSTIDELEELFNRGRRKVNDLRANFGQGEWTKDSEVNGIDDLLVFDDEMFRSLLEFDETVNLDPDLWRVTKEQLELQLTALRNRIKSEKKNVSDHRQEVEARKKELETEMKHDFEERRRAMVESITAEIEEKLHADMEDDEKVITSQYFVCRNIFCDGAFCLKCEKFLKKPELEAHVCTNDPVENLYFQVLETLAKASTQACPNCGASGKKDLACTHITCDKCGHRFCYVCGVAENKLPGGFGPHNNWTLDTPPEEKKCPGYLHYKWGTVRAGNVMEGDAAVALENFHREKQIEAIGKLKQEVNNDRLWVEMERTKFGGKPVIPPPYVPPLRKRLKPYMKITFWVTFIGYTALYFLFFLAMYCWLIHAGRINLHTTECSQPKLAVFGIVHGVLAWFLALIAFCQLVGLKFDMDNEDWWVMGCGIVPAGCTFLTMFGTFVWGAVLFYRTSSSSCLHSLWTPMFVYFNGVWISSGAALFFVLFNIWSIWFFELDL
eukprot:TRINITY_DN1371_c0_g1_i1.p1 TRINITY_DN1371_c0_g1~~TRINITY_DN1371_c0_g1_i1.p1  ORF type:complete len:749 (+),score=175.73 TRINITY_DN1371_c0_g1_i1:111-2357(+)